MRPFNSALKKFGIGFEEIVFFSNREYVLSFPDKAQGIAFSIVLEKIGIVGGRGEAKFVDENNKITLTADNLTNIYIQCLHEKDEQVLDEKIFNLFAIYCTVDINNFASVRIISAEDSCSNDGNYYVSVGDKDSCERYSKKLGSEFGICGASGNDKYVSTHLREVSGGADNSQYVILTKGNVGQLVDKLSLESSSKRPVPGM